MNQIEQRTFDLTCGIVESFGARLDSVEYVKEDGIWFLRLLVDREDGVDIDLVTKISEKVNEIQEIEDMIDNEFYLEVSSLGIERELKNIDDIKNNIGQFVHVLLKRKIDKFYEFEGYLRDVSEESELTIEINLKGRMKKFTFPYDEVSLIRLAIKF